MTCNDVVSCQYFLLQESYGVTWPEVEDESFPAFPDILTYPSSISFPDCFISKSYEYWHGNLTTKESSISYNDLSGTAASASNPTFKIVVINRIFSSKQEGCERTC